MGREIVFIAEFAAKILDFSGSAGYIAYAGWKVHV